MLAVVLFLVFVFFLALVLIAELPFRIVLFRLV